MDDGVGAVTATFTHWGFGQLAHMANAPAEHPRKLPAPLAAQCLEAGRDAHFAGRDEMTVHSLAHAGNTPVLRALTSDKYSRFWYHRVFERLVNLQGHATRGDDLPLGRRPVVLGAGGTEGLRRACILQGNARVV